MCALISTILVLIVEKRKALENLCFCALKKITHFKNNFFFSILLVLIQFLYTVIDCDKTFFPQSMPPFLDH